MYILKEIQILYHFEHPENKFSQNIKRPLRISFETEWPHPNSGLYPGNSKFKFQNAKIKIENKTKDLKKN
jgi:hypothetical protein